MVIEDEGEVVGAMEEEGEQLPGDGDVFESTGDDWRCVPCDPEDFSMKRMAPIPPTPSQREIDEHNIDHLPYRCWCGHCVAGRAVGEAHRSKEPDEMKRPVITFDYLFITRGAKGERHVEAREEVGKKEVLLKILVVKDTGSKTIFAHVVDAKGADEKVVKLLIEDIRWLGYREISLKADNERAIAKLLQETLKAAKENVPELEKITEEKPVAYDHQSNGAVEVAVRQVQGLLRTHKASLEAALKCKIPSRHPVLHWLVEHVAFLLTIRVRGTDGRTAYQRARGKAFDNRLVCFGEICWYKLNIHDPKQDDGKMEPRWKQAPFMGYDRYSNEYILCDGAHERRSRTLQRLPRAEQWDWRRLESITATPGGRQAAMMEFPSRQGIPRPEEVKEKMRVAKRVFLKEKDFKDPPEGFGRTPGCRRCEIDAEKGWGKTKLPHSWTCRRRIEDQLQRTEEGRWRLGEAKKRQDRWVAERGEEEGAVAKGEDVDADVDDPEDLSKQAGEDGRSDEIPSETFSAHAEPGTPRGAGDEDTEMALIMEELDEDARRRVKAKDRDIMELVRELGGNSSTYQRERGRALRAVVSEIYSTPRVTAAAKMLPSLGILPGFALDLTTADEHGHPWDFDLAECREKARRKVIEERPLFLIGSPACTAFSSWQNVNEQRRDPLEVRREYTRAMVHLRFVCELYRLQDECGRYFVHEHPLGATSWHETCITEILEREGVGKTVIDQCQYGQQDPEGEPMKKPTALMSNSDEVLKMMDRRCAGRHGECSRRRGGRHRMVEGKLARLAAIYPFELCRALLTGCRNQLRADGKLSAGLHGIQCPEEDMGDEALRRRCCRLWKIDVEDDDDGATYKDAVTGQPLRAEWVKEARRKELEYFATKGVWAKRRREEAFEKQNKAPITVKWVDVNKGDDDHPNYRSRLVAREIRRAGEESFFAPTPPLESIRLVISLAATDLPGQELHDRRPDSEMRTQVSVMDIARAYFNAKVDPNDAIYVDLPNEDPDKKRGLCGMLLRHMYGTKAAGDGWHHNYSTTLVAMGFERGDASTCVFRHVERRISCSVYGDDFTSEGPKKNLDWLKEELEKHYELTESARLGPGPNDAKEGKILNRIIRWTDEGLEYEADPRQSEKLIEQLGLSGANSTATPGLKVTAEQIASEEPLDQLKHKAFRGVAARANYLAADRPEIQFASKEICRWMAKPTTGGVLALKRLGRYLEGRRRVVYRYPWQKTRRIDVYSDTDWAGCQKTRKSTSGGCLMLGSHLLKSWSSTQSQISLSSGEAEFYGVVRAAGIGLGFKALMSDLKFPLPLRVWTDSTATIGICGRQGLGRLRHVDTQCLWIQQRIRDGSIELRKVRGEVNPADLFTKHLPSRDKVRQLLALFNCWYEDGRPDGAPQLKRAGIESGPILTATAEEATGGGTPATRHPTSPQAVPTVELDGIQYPGVWVEGELVPEAYMHDPSILPHHYGDAVPKMFPRAHAAEAPGDVDPPADDSLWQRGLEIGTRTRWKSAKL